MSDTVTIVTLTKEDLGEMLRDAGVYAVDEYIKRTASGRRRDVDPVYTRDQAAKRLSVSVRTIDKLRAEKKLEFIQEGGNIWIEESAIQKFFSQFRIH